MYACVVYGDCAAALREGLLMFGPSASHSNIFITSWQAA